MEPAATVVEAAEAFTRGFEAARTDWRRALGEAHARGDVTVVWGAGSKGVGFIASIGLDEEVACVVDVNPAKHGMFMPGSGHEIVPPDRIADLMPDLVIVMNPAYLGEIRADLDRLGVRAEVRAL